MSIQLENIIPLGRRYNEYIAMFNFADRNLKSKIVDCGGGPSSFNSEMRTLGHTVVSIDPIYQFSSDQIQHRIDDTFENIIQQAEQNKEKFLWNHIQTVEELRILRKSAMEMFINDYNKGKEEGRYIYAELPNLPFDNNTFDIAICSHLLFLYSDNLSYEFHSKAISEMLRIAKEVRIFPLVDLNSNQSPYLEKVVKEFRAKNYSVEIQKTQYQFQKGANKVLIISKV